MVSVVATSALLLLPGVGLLLLPFGVDRAATRLLRETGWITVAALDPVEDWHAEARRLACGYVLEQGVPVVVG